MSRKTCLQEFAEVRCVKMSRLPSSSNPMHLVVTGDPLWDRGHRIVFPHGFVEGRAG